MTMSTQRKRLHARSETPGILAEMRRHRLLLAAASVLALPQAIAAGKPIPPPAARLVSAVHSAAAAKQTDALRRMMSKDFVSSFGGDGGPEEALALWATDRTSLQNLAKATSAACALQAADYVECPRRAGTGARAGFRLREGKWVFASFVAGD